MNRTTCPTRNAVGKCHQEHGPQRPARMKWIFRHDKRKARATHRNNPMMGILPERRSMMQQQTAHIKSYCLPACLGPLWLRRRLSSLPSVSRSTAHLHLNRTTPPTKMQMQMSFLAASPLCWLLTTSTHCKCNRQLQEMTYLGGGKTMNTNSTAHR